jgi:cell division protease FtsH
MVTEWGMSDKVGPIAYGSDKEFFIGRDMQSHVTYSEQTAALIDSEVKAIIENGLQTARDLLKKNKNILDNMARLLVEKETIFSEEVDMLMQGKSVEEIVKFMEENERSLNENPFENGRKKVVISDEQAKELLDGDKASEKTEETTSPSQPEENSSEQPKETDQKDQ